MDDFNLTETTVRESVLYNGRIIKLHLDEIALPDGASAVREFVSHRGGATILAVDDEGYTYVVRQFRYPYKEVVTEIPAGKLEEGETPAETAARELEEEVGMTGNIVPYGMIYPTPGYTDEKLYVFLATDLVKTHTHFDEDEFLDVVRVPFTELLKQVLNGEIKDAKTAYAVLKYAVERGIRV